MKILGKPKYKIGEVITTPTSSEQFWKILDIDEEQYYTYSWVNVKTNKQNISKTFFYDFEHPEDIVVKLSRLDKVFIKFKE